MHPSVVLALLTLTASGACQRPWHHQHRRSSRVHRQSAARSTHFFEPRDPSGFVSTFLSTTNTGEEARQLPMQDCRQCVDEWIQRDRTILSRFTSDQLCMMCFRIGTFREMSYHDYNRTYANLYTPRQRQYMESLQCRGTRCLDQLRIARRTPVTRKEYRLMSNEERQRFHDAINRLKYERIDGLSKYDLFVKCHGPEYSPASHWGPAFLPFHREYVKQFELALRQVDASVAVPYWDSTLDSTLPFPADSMLWSDEFLGTGRGYVVDGPFAHWDAIAEPNGEASGYSALRRQVGTVDSRFLYTHQDVDNFQSYTHYQDFDACYNPSFEGEHGFVHVFVGGHMGDINISPADPIFFMHHAFIDHIWEIFRQSVQRDPTRMTTEYSHPTFCGGKFHEPREQMRPFFSIKNIDGLSLDYVGPLYEYEERPRCSTTGGYGCTPDSPYVFCHRAYGVCASKVRPGGACWGLEGYDACFQSRCIEGRCM